MFFLGSLQFEYDGVNQTVDSEFDNIRVKTKLVVRPGFIGMMFDEKSSLVLSHVSIHIGIENTLIITLAKKT